MASYSRVVQSNEKWIVLVVDDNGRLAACLEVKGRSLVQAKLDQDRPVSSNEKLNTEVIAWADEANIEILTSGIKLARNELVTKVC